MSDSSDNLPTMVFRREGKCYTPDNQLAKDYFWVFLRSTIDEAGLRRLRTLRWFNVEILT